MADRLKSIMQLPDAKVNTLRTASRGRARTPEPPRRPEPAAAAAAAAAPPPARAASPPRFASRYAAAAATAMEAAKEAAPARSSSGYATGPPRRSLSVAERLEAVMSQPTEYGESRLCAITGQALRCCCCLCRYSIALWWGKVPHFAVPPPYRLHTASTPPASACFSLRRLSSPCPLAQPGSRSVEVRP